ncbi:hypothetical protein [Anaerobaca lacustris]|uniref:Uncharacterized protein n=1 Tax=Anaerobaca lacustris TaxID=3044600 RepID=A0AAW6U1S4_9BACT|nr:hypothetical protein [Sedimentisphaerales bacterium M17dextr]
MNRAEDVSGLVEEYRVLLDMTDSQDSLRKAMVEGAEWTPQAANRLLELANDYGSFMLRNALAISLALGIEDGALGL